MGTITGQEIANRARRILQDQTPGGTRWLDSEVLDWLNDGQRAIILRKPNAKSITADVTLVEGTQQSIPADGVVLLDVIRNVNGAAITPVDREILDAEDRNWHSSTASNDTVHFVFDAVADPKTFYVYPPQTSSPSAVKLVYSAEPTDMASLAVAIDLDDMYANPLLDYLLYRSYSKDAEYSGNDQRALTHYQAFESALGSKGQGEFGVSPNNR